MILDTTFGSSSLGYGFSPDIIPNDSLLLSDGATIVVGKDLDVDNGTSGGFIGCIPLGSPKYIPPVNSLTIIIFNPETMWGFSVDESTNCLKHIAGLKFANNFNSFLNFNRALSGFFENSNLSYCGPPHAPTITASLSKAL